MSRTRSLTVMLLLGSLIVAGCQESTGFEEIKKREVVIADFDGLFLQGGERFEMTATVDAALVHPEFNVRWTNLAREIEVEFYVIRAEDYDPTEHPSQLQNLLWPQGDEGPSFGERQPTKVVLHPEPGSWVLFFFNPKDRTLANRAELSALVKQTFFK